MRGHTLIPNRVARKFRLLDWPLFDTFFRRPARPSGGDRLNRFAAYPRPYKLHLGCGTVRLEGWINVDAVATHPAVDVAWDLTQGIPAMRGSCALMYCEHFLEHLSVDGGLAFLAECRRVLMPDGVLRVAMPSLDVLLEKATVGDWRDQDWLTWPEYQFIQSRAEMLNISFRWWGHQWLYDRDELHRRLREAGFTRLQDVPWGVSEIPELRNLETRRDSLLVCEALP
jgi:predicted SAM-dependent methyltransferase